MKGKKLISSLHIFFTGIYYVNIVLGLGMIGFQFLNFISPKKDVLASYLGAFKIEITSAFQLAKTHVFVDSFSGTPSLAVEGTAHNLYVFVFIILTVAISIGYSYLIQKLFTELKLSVDNGTPFKDAIAHIFAKLSKVSFGVFIVLLAFSSAKLICIKPVVINNLTISPQFDAWLLNFLWLGIGFYLLKEIYNVGLQLKEEQEFTI